MQSANGSIVQRAETQFQPFALLTMNLKKVNQCHYYVYPCPRTLTLVSRGPANVKM